MNAFEQLNQDIINAHNAHYKDSPTGLVKPTEQPNGNLIYHLYSNGEIGYQKGGYAYLKHSEFITEGRLSKYKMLGLKLPEETDNGFSYAILQETECYYFREKMLELLENSKK